MKLTTEDKITASCAVLCGDSFTRGNVTMFMIDRDYCVQKMDGAPSSENRVITDRWSEALHAFEAFLG